MLQRISILIIILLLPVLAAAQTATLQGRVTSATTGEGIANATVRIDGESVQTDADGQFELAGISTQRLRANFTASPISGKVPLAVQFSDVSGSGFQTLEISADGFYAVEKTLQLEPGELRTLDISLSPQITNAAMRFVLNWAAEPADLDLYLNYQGSETFPSGRVYFANKGKSTEFPFAVLDHDDKDGYGPETITVQQLLETTYSVFVNNYSASPALTQSNAELQIYDAEGQAETIQVPANGQGDYWHICDIDGRTGEVTVVNTLQNSPPTHSLGKVSAKQNSQIQSWEWDFDNDGTVDATGPNPNHVYIAPGAYTVRLRISDGNSEADVIKENYIAVTSPDGSLSGMTVNLAQVDASNFPELTARVSVVDEEEKSFIGGLESQNFTLLENGLPVQILTAAETTPQQRAATDVVFVFDASLSMDDRAEQLLETIKPFADSLQRNGIDARYALITYADFINEVYPFTQNSDEFVDWIEGLNYADGGDSKENSLEALARAAQMPFRIGAHRVAILMTDADYYQHGDDGIGQTHYTTESCIALLQAEQVTTFTIAPSQPRFTRLARETGGIHQFVFTPDADFLQPIGTLLTSQYILTFRAQNMAATNQWRRLFVAVQNEAQGGHDDGSYFASSTRLRLNPPAVLGINGKPFTVDVRLENAVDISMGHFFVTYNPERIKVVDVTAGDFFSQDDALQAFVHHVNADSGWIEITASRLSQDGDIGAGGSGVIAGLILQPRQRQCSSTLDFQNHLFYRDEGPAVEMNVSNAEIYSIEDQGKSMLVGDFDDDFDIDTRDFAKLTTYWSPVDAPFGDIGPAEGVTPILQPRADGFVNYEDLFTFTRMWNWYHSTLTDGSVSLNKTAPELSWHIIRQTDETVEIDLLLSMPQHLGMGRLVFDVGAGLELQTSQAGDWLNRDGTAAFMATQNGNQLDIAFSRLADTGKTASLTGSGVLAHLTFSRLHADVTPTLKAETVDLRTPQNLPLAIKTQVNAPRVDAQQPLTFQLANYPNPFNGQTRIEFELPKTASAELTIVNLMGQVVRRWNKPSFDAGVHTVLWDCRDDYGQPVSTGIYWVRLEAEARTLSRKILYLR